MFDNWLLVLLSIGCAVAQNNQPQSGQEAKPSANDKNTVHAYNVTDGADNLAMLGWKGPIQIDLFPIGEGGKIDKSKKETYSMSGDMTVTGSRNKDSINVVMKYAPGNEGSGNFIVKTATLSLNIATTSEIFQDYWRLSTAGLKMSYTYNGQTQNMDQDVTPRFGYSNNKQDLQCGDGYSICAPNRISWSCYDQQLKKVNTSDLAEGSNTAVVHFPQFYLQPFRQGEKKIRLGANWDCEPLIPISIWVGVLLTLGLAAIVWWALSMVGSVYTPSKFDDPKGPALMIAQTD